MRHRWHRPLWLTLAGAAFFLTIELGFFASNLTKIAHGAWLPLTIGFVLFFVMVTWYRGRELVTAERFRVEGPLRDFVNEAPGAPIPPCPRVPGTGVFLNRGKETAPLSMRACVDHLHSLPENAVILSLETLPVPRIRPKERLEIDDLGYQDDRHHLRPGQARLRRGVRRARSWSGRSRRPGSSARSTRERRRSISPGWS